MALCNRLMKHWTIDGKDSDHRTNPGKNARLWTKKKMVERRKAGLHVSTIQKRLKTRRIFRNLERFVGGDSKGDYRYHVPMIPPEPEGSYPGGQSTVSVKVLGFKQDGDGELIPVESIHQPYAST
ncbi:hypothetical protein Tco_0793324 [Tanacetum coccineum]